MCIRDSPKDPKVDLTVTLWKDVLKPVAAVAMGGLALAEIAHYLAVGPKMCIRDSL